MRILDLLGERRTEHIELEQWRKEWDAMHAEAIREEFEKGPGKMGDLLPNNANPNPSGSGG